MHTGRLKHKRNVPATTVIGSYPVFVAQSVIDQYREFSEDMDDPFLATIQQSVGDFVSAGIEYPCTGQTRDTFIRMFLDPDKVEGIKRKESENIVVGKLRR